MKQNPNRKSVVNIASTNTIEPTVVSLVLSNISHFNQLKKRLVGKNNLVDVTYGAGPLAYKGHENKTGSVFAGTGALDPNRFILVFKTLTGINLLESLFQDESLSEIWMSADFSKLEAQAKIPIVKELQVNLFEETTYEGTPLQKAQALMAELASRLSKKKDYRPKSYYLESKKTLVLGSTSSTQLIIAVEETTTSSHYLALKASFHATAASNIYAASTHSNLKRVDSPVAMSIMKLLSFVDVNPIMNAINELCNLYVDSSVLLTKRQRDKIILNSKVKYAKGALNSIVTHMELLPEEQANQYAIILKDFVTELVALSKTNQPAQLALMSVHSVINGLSEELLTLKKPSKRRTTFAKSPEDVELADNAGENLQDVRKEVVREATTTGLTKLNLGES